MKLLAVSVALLSVATAFVSAKPERGSRNANIPEGSEFLMNANLTLTEKDLRSWIANHTRGASRWKHFRGHRGHRHGPNAIYRGSRDAEETTSVELPAAATTVESTASIRVVRIRTTAAAAATTTTAAISSATSITTRRTRSVAATTTTRAASSTATRASITSSSSAAASSSASVSGLAAEALQFHNGLRARKNAAPLTYNATLEAGAQVWANRCVFEHGGNRALGSGENLSAMSGTGSTIGDGIQLWLNEEGDYNPSNPVASHYTQVVWKDTTSVGCAIATCDLAIFDPQFNPSQFMVCEYFPRESPLWLLGSCKWANKRVQLATFVVPPFEFRRE